MRTLYLINFIHYNIGNVITIVMLTVTDFLFSVWPCPLQSVVVASPTATMSHGESVSPIGTFYHPTPSSRARGIPEVGKLPRTSAMSKKFPASGPETKSWLKLQQTNAGGYLLHV